MSGSTENTKFPFSIVPVDAETNEKLLKDFIGSERLDSLNIRTIKSISGEKNGFYLVGPKKYVFPSTYVNHAEKLYNFEARTDDVWISTFPRSGTTMTQELIWLIANDLDYDRARQEPQATRFPFFELFVCFHDGLKDQYLKEKPDDSAVKNMVDIFYTPNYEKIGKLNAPRFIKTHLSFSLMPPSVMERKAKTIYVARHPKDVAVSWYHMNRVYRNFGYINDFSQFWDYFERDLTIWSPYWEHIKEGWNRRHEPNVLFLFYEDLINDLPANIVKIATFLDKQVNEHEFAQLAEHLSIENFRKNASVNNIAAHETGFAITNEPSFIRNGQISGKRWQDEYTVELAARAETWIEKNLQETTLRFPEVQAK